MQNQLAEQLNQYCLQLVSIAQLVDRQPQQPHLRILRERLELQMTQLKTAAQQLASRELSSGVVTQMGAYFKQSFTATIKEAHRMVQIRPAQDGQMRLKEKISVIRQMEEDMGNAWETGRQEQRGDGVLRRLAGNISTLSAQLDQGQLRSVAREYLQKQFLAIRMIAYRLYQQYVAHTHPAVRQQLQEIRNEHELLRSQVAELREVSRELKSEEKRMVKELNELKKVNDLIGRRYFTQENTQGQQVSP